MQPVDATKSPKVHVPSLNHIGLWVDDIHRAVEDLTSKGAGSLTHLDFPCTCAPTDPCVSHHSTPALVLAWPNLPCCSRPLGNRGSSVGSPEGVRFTPGGIRKGAAGHDVTFIHPKGSTEAPLSGQGRRAPSQVYSSSAIELDTAAASITGVLIELVQAPPSVVAAFDEAEAASKTA